MTTTILYIEDDPQHIRMLSKALEFRGYEVLSAESGLEGLEMAVRENPDLILLDMLLPDLPGMEVFYRLRHDPTVCDIPVVGVTASDDVDLHQAALSQGFDDFLEKPLDTRLIDDVLQALLGVNNQPEGR